MKKTNTTNWEIKTLGEVCQIRPPKSEVRTLLKAEDIVSFVPMEDLKVLSKKFPTPKERMLKDVAKSYTYFADGDVLMAKITPCFENGKLGIAQNLRNGIGFGSSEFIVFRTRKKILHPIFLFYLLSSSSFREQGKKVMSGAVGHKRVPKEYVENYKFLLPPLPEQKRIVTILDKKFAAIEELKNITEQQIVDAKELFESRLGEIYSSSDYNFGNLGDSVNIKTGKLNSNAAVVGGDYPFFTCSRQASQIDSYSFDCDAVLLAGNNASADFNVKHYKGKFDAYQRTYVITVLNNAELDIRFVYNLLLHGLAKFKESAVGAGTKFLKIGMIQDFQLPLFTLKEQKQIVKELDELSGKTKELETIFHQKIADLEELKKSYLADAFAGKL
jgi:type I restriction enzyme S subunit